MGKPAKTVRVYISRWLGRLFAKTGQSQFFPIIIARPETTKSYGSRRLEPATTSVRCADL
jgi:hypothetical protein